MAEVPHTGYIHVVASGDDQWLTHWGTGEVIKLRNDCKYDTDFSADGFCFLASASRNAAEMSHSVWARTLLKRTLHKDDAGHLFVNIGGKPVWQNQLRDEHHCRVWSSAPDSDEPEFTLEVWIHTLPVAGMTIFWDVPVLLHVLLGSYSANLTKQRLRSCKRLLHEAGLEDAHIKGSVRGLVASARYDITKGGEGKVSARELVHATDNAKISTALLMWFLMSCGVHKPRSGQSESFKATGILQAFSTHHPHCSSVEVLMRTIICLSTQDLIWLSPMGE